MRLPITDDQGAAFFIITHSQYNGGYIAFGKNCKSPNDHQIAIAEPDFAGEIVWWDHMDSSHPGGCNHPGNGGQIATTVVIVGQDWTKTYLFTAMW